jgi:hypothetical protein
MRKLFLIFFIISPYLLFGQKSEFEQSLEGLEGLEARKAMNRYFEGGEAIINGIDVTSEILYLFISASNGLRGRAEPNINSRVLTTQPYGKCIYFYERTTYKDTIDGITDYWYHTFILSPPDTGGIWFFGGYLTKYFENDIFIGRWVDEKDNWNWTEYIFEINNKNIEVYHYNIVRGEREETKSVIYTGTYERKDNNLTLNFSENWGTNIPMKNIKETKKAIIKIIDTNTMQLIFDNGETANLKRYYDKY